MYDASPLLTWQEGPNFKIPQGTCLKFQNWSEVKIAPLSNFEQSLSAWDEVQNQLYLRIAPILNFKLQHMTKSLADKVSREFGGKLG
jgi:hypothetical protein